MSIEIVGPERSAMMITPIDGRLAIIMTNAIAAAIRRIEARSIVIEVAMVKERASSFQIRSRDPHDSGIFLMPKTDRHARRLAFSHPINRIVIAADPADQLAINHAVAAVVRRALAACVEHRAHFAVVAAREHEAQPLAGVVGVAKKPCTAGTQRRHVDGHIADAGHGCAVRRRGEDEKRGACREHQPAENPEFARTHSESMLS